MEGAGATAKKHRDYTNSKIGMWLFLFTEVFFFFGPLLLYSVFRLRYTSDFSAGSSELDLYIGTFNTLILLTSSLSMALSVSAVKKGSKGPAVALLVATALLGSLFLFNKYVEWDTKILHGIYPNSAELLKEPRGKVLFYGLYFFLTGLHGLHVFAGVMLVAAMAVLVFMEKITSADFIRLENSGLYWHLVDVVWIYLFPLFYLVS